MQELNLIVNGKSSVIYYVPNEKKHYIVTKGSLQAIESIIKSSDKTKFNSIVEFNDTFPYLRIIAFAYRSINYNQSKPLSYEEKIINDNFISTGIQDELQDNCVGAVNNLVSNNKKYLRVLEIDMKQHYILEIN